MFKKIRRLEFFLKMGKLKYRVCFFFFAYNLSTRYQAVVLFTTGSGIVKTKSFFNASLTSFFT